jgi:hypothetical protein
MITRILAIAFLSFIGTAEAREMFKFKANDIVGFEQGHFYESCYGIVRSFNRDAKGFVVYTLSVHCRNMNVKPFYETDGEELIFKRKM